MELKIKPQIKRIEQVLNIFFIEKKSNSQSRIRPVSSAPV